MQHPSLELGSRKRIYDCIEQNPGLHFREVQRRTGTATGALQYHLDQLEKNHLVRSEKIKNTKHFFSIKEDGVMQREQSIMPLLRQESIRHILIALLSLKRSATMVKIVQLTNLPYSTVSRHLEELNQHGLVEKKRVGKSFRFSPKNAESIAQLLVTYKTGFLDSAVDQFVELWQGMEVEKN